MNKFIFYFFYINKKNRWLPETPLMGLAMLYYGTGYYALREESSQTNVILQYKLLESILSAVCSIIQQS